MGWFALAVLVGILVSISPLSIELIAHRRRLAIAAVVFLVALVLASETPLNDWRGVRAVVDFLLSGSAARIAAGLVLGYLTPQFFSAGFTPAWHQAAAFGAIFVFACVAPHIDTWMRKLSGFKSSFIEFQLASTTAVNQKRIAVEKLHFNFAEAPLVFATLASYPSKIDLDLAFVKEFNPGAMYAFRGHANLPLYPVYDRLAFERSAADVKRVFDTLLQPVSECIIEHLKAGLDENRIKRVFIGPASRLQEIVENEMAAWPFEPPDADHGAFWEALGKALKDFDALSPRGPKCATPIDEYFKKNPVKADKKAYPRLATTQDVGYLAVSAALFLTFVEETKTAIKILEMARGRPVVVDHRLLVLLAYLRNATGQPWTRVFEPYEESRRIAKERVRLITEACSKSVCSKAKDMVLKREEDYLEIAANNMTVALTDDLALGVSSAKDMVATVRSLAEEVKAIGKKAREQGRDDFADSFTDTYAYALVVIEAQKEKPDAAVVKEQERELRLLVERLQRRYDEIVNNDRLPTRAEEFNLRAARLHAQYARELAAY